MSRSCAIYYICDYFYGKEWDCCYIRVPAAAAGERAIPVRTEAVLDHPGDGGGLHVLDVRPVIQHDLVVSSRVIQRIGGRRHSRLEIQCLHD